MIKEAVFLLTIFACSDPGPQNECAPGDLYAVMTIPKVPGNAKPEDFFSTYSECVKTGKHIAKGMAKCTRWDL